MKATLEPPRIVREPDFIDLNDLERLCNEDTLLPLAVCKYSTKIKRDIALGRIVDSDEYHHIKDWFALLPNDEARAFAKWLLELARDSWYETFNKEHGPNPQKV